MFRNKMDEEEYRRLSEAFGIPLSSVRAIISSFFSVIYTDAKKLPFNDSRKIFSSDRFEDYAKVANIPFIGRIGPSYTRYLAWRRNEAKGVEQKKKVDFRLRLSQNDIEELAKRAMNGESIEINKKKPNELYDRVWIVGKNSKKMARQVIPKQDKDVQD